MLGLGCSVERKQTLVSSIKHSWRLWLPSAATLLLLGSYLATCLNLDSVAPSILLLLWAFVFPFFWPRQFGSWAGLGLLLPAILLPALAAARWPDLASSQPQLIVAASLWMLAICMMLPATLGLLLWRRLAPLPVMLLALAVAPPASLLAVMVQLQLGLLGADPATASAQTPANMLRFLAAATPLWFVNWACCLGPIFFAGSFGWLLYREGTRGMGKTAPTPSPPARVEDAPRSVDTPSPGGS